jgi:hypothetical protein
MWPNLAPVWISSVMAQALVDLPVDITFLTTWEDKVNSWGLQAALGWNFPYLPFIKSYNDPTLAKELALLNWHQRNPGPFISIDDDYLLHRALKLHKTELTSPHLLIQTGARQGITPKHIQQIQAFCSRLLKTPEINL